MMGVEFVEMRIKKQSVSRRYSLPDEHLNLP